VAGSQISLKTVDLDGILDDTLPVVSTFRSEVNRIVEEVKLDES